MVFGGQKPPTKAFGSLGTPHDRESLLPRFVTTGVMKLRSHRHACLLDGVWRVEWGGEKTPELIRVQGGMWELRCRGSVPFFFPVFLTSGVGSPKEPTAGVGMDFFGADVGDVGGGVTFFGSFYFLCV